MLALLQGMSKTIGVAMLRHLATFLNHLVATSGCTLTGTGCEREAKILVTKLGMACKLVLGQAPENAANAI